MPSPTELILKEGTDATDCRQHNRDESYYRQKLYKALVGRAFEIVGTLGLFGVFRIIYAKGEVALFFYSDVRKLFAHFLCSEHHFVFR